METDVVNRVFIWLGTSTLADIDIDDRLRNVFDELKIFHDTQKCESYVRNICLTNPIHLRIVLIVDTHLGELFVSLIHDLPQIKHIYVICMRKETSYEWTNHFIKVKAIISGTDELVTQIQFDQTSRHNDTLSINYFKRDNESADRSSTGINGDFIYSQLLVDILLRMKIDSCDKHEIIDTFKKKYHNNKAQLQNVAEFEQNYESSKALWWYTKDTFLYRELNRALRARDFDMLFLFGFFIRDIHKQLNIHQCSTSVHVYRGQLIASAELEMLKQSINEYISMNSFLSTTQNRHVALCYLGEPGQRATNSEQRVWFEIEANAQLDGAKPFADIDQVSLFHGEEEILFMLGAIFRLLDVSYDNDDQLWIIRMILCSDHHHNLKPVFDYRRTEFGQASKLSFGLVLRDMGKFDMAASYFHRLVIDLPANHPNIAACYHALGSVAKDKGNYDTSLEWYQKALALDMISLPNAPDHPDIATTYNNLGATYEFKRDFDRARHSYDQALKISQRLYDISHENHHHLLICYSNLGGVYQQENNYPAALECHEKALIIGKQYLPENHSHLAALHNNIAIVHWSLKHTDLALNHFTSAVSILEKSLPSQHPDIALTVENIAEMHEDNGELKQALAYYQRAATIYRHTLPPEHAYRIDIEKHIRRVTDKIIS